MTRDIPFRIAATLTACFAVGVAYHGVSSGKLTRLAPVAESAEESEFSELPTPGYLDDSTAAPTPSLTALAPEELGPSVFPELAPPELEDEPPKSVLVKRSVVVKREVSAPPQPKVKPPAKTIPRVVQILPPRPEIVAPPKVAKTITKPKPTPPPQREPVVVSQPEPMSSVVELAPTPEVLPELPAIDTQRYSLAASNLSQKLQPEVQQAFAAGQQGSLFVSEQRFIEVLQKIAAARDAEVGTRKFTAALRSGMAALEEANDFATPAGVATAEIDPAAIAASHVTPVVRKAQSDEILPHEAVAHYHQYAVSRFEIAVGGEPAASMALYGLGRVHAGRAEAAPQAALTAQTCYEAALAVHNGNHLAANELGVALAQAGRYQQASGVLRYAVQSAAPSHVHHNLAVVESQLGNAQLAAGAEAYAAQLLAQEKATGAYGRSKGVQWVSPQQFAMTSEGWSGGEPSAAPLAPSAPVSTAQAPPASDWRQALGTPKRVFGFPEQSPPLMR